MLLAVCCCLAAIPPSSLAELEEQVYPVYREGGVDTGPGEKLEEKIEKEDGILTVQEQGQEGQEEEQEEEKEEVDQDDQHEQKQNQDKEEEQEQEQEEWAEVLPTAQLLVGEFPHHFEPNSTLSDFSFEGQGIHCCCR